MSPGRLGKLCGWALQGYLVAGHCRDTLRLGTAGILCGWALQGYSAVGHCRDTLRLGTAGILCSWALQGYLVAGHCRDTLRGWALQESEGEDKIDSKILQRGRMCPLCVVFTTAGSWGGAAPPLADHEGRWERADLWQALTRPARKVSAYHLHMPLAKTGV